MRLGCVITTKDNAGMLADCLDALIAGTHVPDIWYVTNDGSSDGTQDVIMDRLADRPGVKVLIARHPTDVAGSLVHVKRGYDWLSGHGRAYRVLRIGDDVVVGRTDVERLMRAMTGDGMVYVSGRCGDEDYGFRDGFSIMDARYYRRYQNLVIDPYFINAVFVRLAMMHGMMSYHPEINPELRRRTGTNYDRRLWSYRGRSYRYCGYDFPVIAFMALRLARRSPLSAASMMAAWIRYRPARGPMDELRRYVRREYRQRIMRRIRI